MFIALISFGCQDNQDIMPPEPDLPVTNGGKDFLDVDEFSVQLNADDLKEDEKGVWKIHSGMIDEKVSFTDKSDPKTVFNGLPGEKYKLLWEVRKGSKSTIDTVTVSFSPLNTEISIGVEDYFSTRVILYGKSYGRGSWTVEGKYHHLLGNSDPAVNSSSIKLIGFENVDYKITWTTWYGSKSASATYQFRTGLYHQDEALEDLSILNREGYYKRNSNGDVTEINLNGDPKAWMFGDLENFPSLKSLVHLTKLELSGDGFHAFPEVITSNYHKLKYLDISSNYFPSIPENLGDLKELDTLILNNNLQLKSIPTRIGELKKLKYINIAGIGISTLPESFSELVNLRYLNLELNGIEKLPEQIGNLKNLEVFRGPVLYQSIPNSFSNLAKLRFCFFTVTGDEAILPADFGRLTELDTLWLYGNYKKLPESFGNLRKLDFFIANNGSGFNSIPESIGNLVNLTKLHLSVDVPSLPKSFTQLVNLQYLSFKGNLNYLPNDFDKLENLVSFGAIYVQLKEIPTNFGNLENLREFNVAGNEITSIPESVGKLKNIRELNFARNDISTFPRSFANLANTLYKLAIHGNAYSEEELNILKTSLPYTNIVTWMPGDD